MNFDKRLYPWKYHPIKILIIFSTTESSSVFLPSQYPTSSHTPEATRMSLGVDIYNRKGGGSAILVCKAWAGENL